MINKVEKQFGTVKVVERSDYKWGVTDLEGNEIVPFGKYDWIGAFYSGLARVKIGKEPSNLKDNHNKWGIIDTAGNEKLPVEYDAIWKFAGKNRSTTNVEKDGKRWLVNLNSLITDDNSEAVSHDIIVGRIEDLSEKEHYDDFAGTYAQDVAGYSDEDIYDAFDGDPDAYWNID
jgi:hypothetical protein